jgi:hypothetical protein
MSSVLRGFIASAGPQPHDPVVALRRMLLERMRAGDEKGATACMAAYFEGLNEHLLREEQAGGSEPARRPNTRRPARPAHCRSGRSALSA